MNRSLLLALPATLALGASVPLPPAAAADEPAPAPIGVLAPSVSRAKVALIDLEVEGEDANPALGMQMQDGFVLGLVRAGIPVLDPVDVSRRLAKNPELQHCDTSPCLKNLGRILDTRFAMRVKV